MTSRKNTVEVHQDLWGACLRRADDEQLVNDIKDGVGLVIYLATSAIDDLKVCCLRDLSMIAPVRRELCELTHQVSTGFMTLEVFCSRMGIDDELAQELMNAALFFETLSHDFTYITDGFIDETGMAHVEVQSTVPAQGDGVQSEIINLAQVSEVLKDYQNLLNRLSMQALSLPLSRLAQSHADKSWKYFSAQTDADFAIQKMILLKKFVF